MFTYWAKDFYACFVKPLALIRRYEDLYRALGGSSEVLAKVDEACLEYIDLFMFFWPKEAFLSDLEGLREKLTCIVDVELLDHKCEGCCHSASLFMHRLRDVYRLWFQLLALIEKKTGVTGAYKAFKRSFKVEANINTIGVYVLKRSNGEVSEELRREHLALIHEGGRVLLRAGEEMEKFVGGSFYDEVLRDENPQYPGKYLYFFQKNWEMKEFKV